MSSSQPGISLEDIGCNSDGCQLLNKMPQEMAQEFSYRFFYFFILGRKEKKEKKIYFLKNQVNIYDGDDM